MHPLLCEKGVNDDFILFFAEALSNEVSFVCAMNEITPRFLQINRVTVDTEGVLLFTKWSGI